MKNLFLVYTVFIMVMQLGSSYDEEDFNDTALDSILFTEYLAAITENAAGFSALDIGRLITQTDEYEHTTTVDAPISILTSESLLEEYSTSAEAIAMDTTILTESYATSEETMEYTESSSSTFISEDEVQEISMTTENNLNAIPNLHIGNQPTTIIENQEFTTSSIVEEELLKEYSLSSEKNIAVLENPFSDNVAFEEEITDVTTNETLLKTDATPTKEPATESSMLNGSYDDIEEKRENKDITLNETLHKADSETTENASIELINLHERNETWEEEAEDTGTMVNETLVEADSASSGKTLMKSTTLNESYVISEENKKNTDAELDATEANRNGFENTSTTPIYENLTTMPKIQNNSKSEDMNPFTIFMVQKQCTFNRSTETFDKYPDLRVLVEEVEDCLYFAFIKIRANNPSEIKEAIQKFEEKQFHVIKVKQNAGNQDKSRLVLKEHLDCKKCLVKGKDIKEPDSDIDDIKNNEKRSTTYDVNDLSLYLALAGSVIASTVLIANIYLCYCRRKQGHSEIPSFNSKPEKFKMTPIPRPSILNGDNVFSQNYLSGRSLNPLRSSEQQAFGKMNYPRNENHGSEFRESGQWMPKRKQAAPKSEQSEFPFIDNPTFEVW